MFWLVSTIFLTTACSDGHAEGTHTTLKGHRSDVYAVAYSPFGELLASAGLDETIRIWNVKEKKEQTSFHWPGKRIRSIRALAFSSDGKLLAAGVDGHEAKLWEMATGKGLPTIQDEHIDPSSLA